MPLCRHNWYKILPSPKLTNHPWWSGISPSQSLINQTAQLWRLWVLLMSTCWQPGVPGEIQPPFMLLMGEFRSSQNADLGNKPG